MGAKYGAATSLRSCCVVLGDQDGWGTNRLSKAESILGTGMSQNLSRGRRHACQRLDGLLYALERDHQRDQQVHHIALDPWAVLHGAGHIGRERPLVSCPALGALLDLGVYVGDHLRCQPWRAKRRLVDPSSREAALFSRRALRQRENKVGLRTRRPVIGRQVRSSNELAKLLRSAW